MKKAHLQLRGLLKEMKRSEIIMTLAVIIFASVDFVSIKDTDLRIVLILLVAYWIIFCTFILNERKSQREANEEEKRITASKEQRLKEKQLRKNPK